MFRPHLVRGEDIHEKIQALAPKNETQRSLRAEALKIATDLERIRSVLFA